MTALVCLGVGLAVLALLPVPAAWLATTAAIIALGVPHGALDGEVARPMLQPRFGRAWFLVFALPYLALAGGVLLLWRVSPLGALAAFLAMSVWHFGREEAGPGRPVAALVRGGLPIAAPVLLHPAGTWAVFASAAQIAPAGGPPGWLVGAAWVWVVLAAGWVWRQEWPVVAAGAGLVALFAALPPLTAFAIYFLCLHAPAHVRGLIAGPWRAPRVSSWAHAAGYAAPVTALTVGIGAALWPFYAGTPAVRLLGLTLQGLSALTLPHMLLDAGAERWGHVILSGGEAALPMQRSRAVVATDAGCAGLPNEDGRHAYELGFAGGGSAGGYGALLGGDRDGAVAGRGAGERDGGCEHGGAGGPGRGRAQHAGEPAAN